MMPVP